MVARLGAGRRPLARARRRVRSARDGQGRQGELGPRRRDEARGRAAACGLARPGRDRGPGRHPQRQSQQCAHHLSRARQAGPRRAPRDAHDRARHGRPPGDLRQGPGRPVRDHVDGRAGAARRPLLGAEHPHGARGRGREAPARRQGRTGPPEPPRRRRPHREDRAPGRRHDAREPPPARGRQRPLERRRPLDGQGRAHPGGRRREARRQRGERDRHAPDTRPSRVGPALLGLGRGRGPSRVGVRRDRRTGRGPRGQRARRVLAQGDQARRSRREVRRSGGQGRRQHPRRSGPGRRHHVRGHRGEPGATS